MSLHYQMSVGEYSLFRRVKMNITEWNEWIERDREWQDYFYGHRNYWSTTGTDPATYVANMILEKKCKEKRAIEEKEKKIRTNVLVDDDFSSTKLTIHNIPITIVSQLEKSYWKPIDDSAALERLSIRPRRFLHRRRNLLQEFINCMTEEEYNRKLEQKLQYMFANACYTDAVAKTAKATRARSKATRAILRAQKAEAKASVAALKAIEASAHAMIGTL